MSEDNTTDPQEENVETLEEIEEVEAPEEEEEVPSEETEEEDLPIEDNLILGKFKSQDDLIEAYKNVEAQSTRMAQELRAKQSEQKVELSEEQKQVIEFAKKNGLVLKEDLEAHMKKQQMQVADTNEFEQFKLNNPEAKAVYEIVKDLGRTERFISTSYQEIYDKNLRGLVAPKKVLKKKVVGMGSKSEGNKTSNKLTREAIANMSPQEYAKRKSEIMDMAAKGLIT